MIGFKYLKSTLAPVRELRVGLPLGGQEPSDRASAISVSRSPDSSLTELLWACLRAQD